MENISILKIKWFKREIELLKERGISKADIARQLDILPQYINSLISGNRGLTDQFLDKFIDKFNINQFDLFHQADNYQNQLGINRNDNVNEISPTENSIIYKMYKEKDEENKSLLKEIGSLEERIRQLEANHAKGLDSAKNASTNKRSSHKTDDVGSVNVL